jgi:hypothetical protein
VIAEPKMASDSNTRWDSCKIPWMHPYGLTLFDRLQFDLNRHLQTQHLIMKHCQQ